MTDSFSSYHPIINMFFFMLVLVFSMFFMHPACLVISFISAFTYSIYLNGKKALRFSLIFILPILIITALVNPLFNHKGGTILTYLRSGNPLTLESIVYGLAAALMLVAVISWFSCFNTVMTADKFAYLLGRVIPSLSLILYMSFRFIPSFKAQIKVISDAQKCIGRDMSNGSIISKARHGIRIISIMVTWVLENAIETADSMKGRGYGLPGRTAFSIFRFDRRDAFALLYILSCAAVVLTGAAMGAYHFRYYPTIKGDWTGAPAIVVFTAYFALGAFPLIINIKEDIVWKRIESKT